MYSMETIQEKSQWKKLLKLPRNQIFTTLLPIYLKDMIPMLVERVLNSQEDKNKEGVCVCGKTGLRWMFFMRLVDCDGWQFHIKQVGSECINWFARANHQSVLAVFRSATFLARKHKCLNSTNSPIAADW